MFAKKWYFLLFSFFCLVPIYVGADSFSIQQKAEVEKIVHDYLLKQPEIITQAIVALQQKEINNAQKKFYSVFAHYVDTLLYNRISPAIGNLNASKVAIIEFLDFQCGHCKEMANVLESLLQYNPDIKIIYKHLPVFGESSVFAAKAAMAVSEIAPHTYPAFHNALLKNTSSLTDKQVLLIAKKLGINTQKLMQVMQDPSIQEELSHNQQLARALGIMGTPSFIITPVVPRGMPIAENKVSFWMGANSAPNMQKFLDKAK